MVLLSASFWNKVLPVLDGAKNILIAILVFCLIVVIHELGHFATAKLFKVKVNEFAIGMGPIMKKWQKGETRYALKWLPIGGSVSMEGEDGTSDEPRAFNRKPVWQRMIIILAGAIMNLILGFVLLFITTASSERIGSTTISGFREGAVTNSKLAVGDKIVGIDGMHVFSVMDINYKLFNNVDSEDENGEKISSYNFTVVRNGKKIQLPNVVFDKNVYPDFTVGLLDKNFINITKTAFNNTMSTAQLIWASLADIITGKYGIKDLSGPVGVVKAVGDSAGRGIQDLLFMAAFITINLGVFNLLPFPALDGARFVFLLIELIRRKPVKPEHEGLVHLVGISLLFLLMIVVTFQDIWRLFVPQ